MTPTPEPLNFDWHEENRQDSGKGWAAQLILSLMTQERQKAEAAGIPAADMEWFENLSKKTNKFTEVEMRVIINGEEQDATVFFERMNQAFDWAVDRKARELVSDIANTEEGAGDLFDGLEQILRDAQGALHDHLHAGLDALGVKYSPDEGYEY